MSRLLARLLPGVLCFLLSPHLYADYPAGADWLEARIQSDGSISSTQRLTSTWQATAAGLEALKFVGRGESAAFVDAQAYLGDDNRSTTYSLARRLLAGVAGEDDAATLVSRLKEQQGVGGAFAARQGYTGTVLDTAFALSALAGTGIGMDDPSVRAATNYLLRKQADDGSWSVGGGPSNVYVTAQAMRALQPSIRNHAVDSALDEARQWMLDQRASDGTLGQPWRTAAAILAIARSAPSKTVYGDTVSALRNAQESDGSWNGEALTTALAVQALALASQPQPNPNLGRVDLLVVDAEAGIPVEGARVSLTGPASEAATTRQDGSISIGDLPAGEYAVEITADAYQTETGEFSLDAGEQLDLGRLNMLLDAGADTAVLRGAVTDRGSGDPLAGVSIAVSGSASGSTTTVSDGRFRLNGLAPGEVDVAVEAQGYRDLNASLTLTAGEVATLNPGLDPVSAGTTLKGTVTARDSGAAIPGASVSVLGADTASTTTGSDGGYEVADLLAGSFTITIDADGYEPATAPVDVDDGQTLEFSPSLVAEGGSSPDPGTATLTGTILDQETGAGVEAASVALTVEGSTTQTPTDATGTFIASEMFAGTVELRISHPDYRDRTVQVDLSAGVTLDVGSIPLAPGSSSGFDVAGTVVDSLSNEPIGDARVTLAVDKWKRIELDRTYDDPVVVAGPLTHNNDRSLSVRVRNVTSDSFEVSMQVPCGNESGYNGGGTCDAGTWSDETLVYMVVEEGVWQLDNGTRIEAGREQVESVKFRGSPDSEIPVDVRFTENFRQAPAVLHDVMSSNDPAWITSTVWGPGSESDPAKRYGFTLSLEAAEVTKDHGAETVGWIAMAPGTGTIGGVDYEIGAAPPYGDPPDVSGHDEGCFDVTESTLGQTPYTLIDQTSRSGRDGGWARYCGGGSADSIRAHIEEDQGGDKERSHVREYLSWMIFADSVSAGLGTTSNPGGLEVGSMKLDDAVVPRQRHSAPDGTVDFRHVDAGQGVARVEASGYQTANKPLYVPQKDTDLGQIRLRPEGAFTPRPDLVAHGVTGIQTTPSEDGFRYEGRISAKWENAGSRATENAFVLRAFVDRNGNGEFDDNDRELGTTTIESPVGAGEMQHTPIPLSGRAAFPEAPVALAVDARGDLVESDEHNNIATRDLACRREPPDAANLEMSLQWARRGEFAGHEHPSATGPPAVGQFSDDNGDGKINNADIPDIVVPSGRGGNSSEDTILGVFSGDDGRLLWAYHDSAGIRVSHRSTPAIADLDGDGRNEIVVVNFGGTKLLRFEHDGPLTWVRDTHYPGRAGTASSHAPLVANLDQQGAPEIVLGSNVFDPRGDLLWSGSEDAGTSKSPEWGAVPVAADVHDEPGQELSAGRTLYSARGEVIWHRDDLPDDGVTGLGDFDDDPEVEIVIVTDGRVFLLQHTGQTIWNVSLGTRGPGGPPTVADFDNDGEPEVGVAGRRRYVVFETDGTVKWQVGSVDSTSGVTGSSVFDFDADGKAEVLYADERRFRILDGATGEERVAIRNSSVTKYEYPVVANVDKDAGAEVVLTSSGYSEQADGLRVFDAGNGQWAPTRSIWNQHAYHVDNINDDGSIPVEEEKSWRTHNTWRLNSFPHRDPLDQPDMVASHLELVDNGRDQPAGLRMRAGNGGAGASTNGIPVAFYDGAPDAGGTELGRTRIASLEAGSWSEVTLSGVDLATLSGGDLYARIDPQNRMIECRADNNTARASSVTTSTLGSVEVGTDVPGYTPDEGAQISADVLNEGSFAGTFNVSLKVEDQDGATVTTLGSTDLGELASGASASVSGSWSFEGVLAGSYSVVAVLRDHAGQVVDQDRTALDLLATEEGDPVASLHTRTGRTVYSPDATVRLDHLAENVTSNGSIDNARLTTVVETPDGSEYHRETTALGDLAPGAVRQRSLELALADAPEGDWTVTGRLYDGEDRLMAMSPDAFTVELVPANRVQGSVEALHAERTPGEPQTCTDRLSNPLERPAEGLEIRRLVLNLTAGQAEQRGTETLDLVAGESSRRQRSIDTTGFEEGRYSCALQVNTNAGWRTLGRAAFRMTEPPIDIGAGMGAGDRGRLLVLLDPVDRQWHARHDRYGPFCSPGPEEQRQWLEEHLDAVGWSYTIVTGDDRFREELYSDGYAVVALLQEGVKIDERVQRELVEAVEEDGLGLVVAGMHDRRNGRVESALGIRGLGSVRHADAVRVFDSPVSPANRLDFAIQGHPRWLYPKQAHRIGEYKSDQPHGGHPGHGWFKRVQSSKNGSGGPRPRTRTGWRSGCEHDRDRGDHPAQRGRASGHHKPGQGASGKPDRHAQTKTFGGPHGRFFKPKTALTRYKHGSGRTVAAGFDLLLQGTASEGEDDFGRLLLDALDHVHPDQLRPEADSIWPLSLQLHNRGIATPGRVLVTLPAGAQVVDPGPGSVNDAGQWIWAWQLPGGARRSAGFWVRLPDRTGSVLFDARVQTGSVPDWQPQKLLDYSLTVQRGYGPDDDDKHHHR